MKYLLLPVAFLLLLVGFWRFGPLGSGASNRADFNDIALCGPSLSEDISALESGKFVIALPGWGSYSYKISTSNDSAQFYFDQGLNMYYGYHMKEAVASFMEATRLDPGCAMTYWGQALAMGPYYNAAHSYTIPGKIPEVLAGMNKNMGRASEKEKHLIKAMNRRYSSDPSVAKTKTFDKAYAQELKELIHVYPNDLDIKTWYVDAIMLMHAWDFWNHDGTAKEWTPEVVALCEKVLKSNPDHPAALHYHIHLTEASRHPEVALANADALKKLLPGVAHMVHMASHEYQRNGLYAKGVEVNDLADNQLMIYESIAKNLALNKHSPHYFAVQSYCALSGGMYDKGMQSALRCRGSVSPVYENTYDQYLFMIPVLTQVRMGKWSEILEDSIQPDANWPYANVIGHFAKGMALVNTGKADEAVAHLAQLRERAKDPILEKRRIPFNSPVQMTGIAENILDAAILFSNKKYDDAIQKLNAAIAIEDKLIYTEPNDWPVPVRQFLGAYLLKLRKPVLAEKVYREDLERNPGNGWSLLGLHQSLKMQKKKDTDVYKAQYVKAFLDADRLPPASAFIQ
jgi:tetratricopeptide (TPR) repeat protein